MYKFIDSISSKEERLKQLQYQNKNLGLEGFYKNKMIPYMQFYHMADFKVAVQLITPKQSIFSLVKVEHQTICFPILELLYNKENKELSKNGDILSCIKNKIIFVKVRDTDLSTKEKEVPMHNRKFYFFIPPYFNRYQYEEMKKIINIRNQFNNRFRDDFIGIIHYLDEELKDYKIYPNEEVDMFINEIAQGYIKEVESTQNERLLLDINQRGVSIDNLR